MDIISLIFSLGFDAILSAIIAFPLALVGSVIVIKKLGDKAFTWSNIKQNTDKTSVIYFVTGFLLFLMLFLLPSQFSSRGKLDAVTYILMILPGIMFLYWILSKNFRNLFGKRLTKILWGVLVVGLLGSFLVFYGVVIESNRIIVKKVEIDVEETHEKALGTKAVVLMGDVHMGSIKQEPFLKRVIGELNQVSKMDLGVDRDLFLLIPGDFIAGKFDEASMLYPFAELSEKYQTYAILGNHDFNLTSEKSGARIKTDAHYKAGSDEEEQMQIAAEVERVLTDSGVNVLRNNAVNLGSEAENVVLIGVDDIWSTSSDAKKALAEVQETDYVILLAHNPDVVIKISDDEDYADLVDLVLAGHTHGGEIRFPAIPGISERGFPLFPLPTYLGQEYDKGYFEYEGRYATIPLYITSGVGQTGTKARLFNPPEIVVITFK